jgi:protein-arginine kinase activator protein McsA
MRRPKGYCPTCESTVEFFADGIGAPGRPWRCGNCFQGFDEDQVKRFEKVQAELDAHELERQNILNDALRP